MRYKVWDAVTQSGAVDDYLLVDAKNEEEAALKYCQHYELVNKEESLFIQEVPPPVLFKVKCGIFMQSCQVQEFNIDADGNYTPKEQK
jgi:hypothetical protein